MDNNTKQEAPKQETHKRPPYYDMHIYQLQAKEFADYNNEKMYPFFGLAEEAGEVCGKVAKYLRGDKGAAIDLEAWAKELGDVLWMVSQCCEELNISMGAVAQHNIEKLTKRKANGTIKGDGDNR